MRQHNSFIILHDYPDPVLAQMWRSCLARADFPANYNAPEFFLEPLWAGRRPFAILSTGSAGSVLGVLTGLHEGNAVVCGNPFRSQICIDRKAEPEEVADSLVAGVLAEAGPAEIVSVYSWRWAPLDGFRTRGFRWCPMAGCVVLDLTLGPDALFRQFDENRRRNIRRAIRDKVEISPAHSEERAREFYNVYLAWRRTPRKKIIGEEIPLEMWEGLSHLKNNRRFLLAHCEGKVIAGITLRFYPGGLLEFSSGCGLEEYLHLRPHDLLQWRAIEWGCNEGFLRYSLGGTDEFHRKFGGVVVPFDRYWLDRTMLRRHDLRELTTGTALRLLDMMPRSFGQSVRRLLGKA